MIVTAMTALNVATLPIGAYLEQQHPNAARVEQQHPSIACVKRTDIDCWYFSAGCRRLTLRREAHTWQITTERGVLCQEPKLFDAVLLAFSQL